MIAIGLTDYKILQKILETSHIRNVLVLSKSIFDNKIFEAMENQGIKIFELFGRDQIRDVKSRFIDYLSLVDHIRNVIKNVINNFEIQAYISYTTNPFQCDIVLQQTEFDYVIVTKSIGNLINDYYQVSHNFIYQLPIFKPIDFFYFFYHFNGIDKYRMNFLILGVPEFYVDWINTVIGQVRGKFIRMSDCAKIFAFIPESLIEKTLLDYVWDLMIKLRYNCQWDRVQTSQTIKNHLIEEAYEVLDSIESNNVEKFKNEMGDLLLQIIFHSQIQSDFKNFNFYDVVKAMVDKLISRHPHVFSENKTDNIQQILVEWEKMKVKENKGKMIDLPKSAPSLLKLYLLYRKIKRLNIQNEFNELVSKIISLHNPNIASILNNLHLFYLYQPENLENVLNLFIDKLVNTIETEKILE
ncbi:MAG: MazG nucleotide pyrophosphohydrolase domain-containing protein [bacterium]